MSAFAINPDFVAWIIHPCCFRSRIDFIIRLTLMQNLLLILTLSIFKFDTFKRIWNDNSIGRQFEMCTNDIKWRKWWWKCWNQDWRLQRSWKITDVWGVGISKNNCATSLDRDIDFSISVIWISSSILDDNDNEVSCEDKDIDFCTFMMWISSSILNGNDNELFCEGKEIDFFTSVI